MIRLANSGQGLVKVFTGTFSRGGAGATNHTITHNTGKEIKALSVRVVNEAGVFSAVMNYNFYNGNRNGPRIFSNSSDKNSIDLVMDRLDGGIGADPADFEVDLYSDE